MSAIVVSFFLIDTPENTLPTVQIGGTTYVLGVADKSFGIRVANNTGNDVIIDVKAEGNRSCLIGYPAEVSSFTSLRNKDTDQRHELTFTSTELVDKPKGAALQDWQPDTGALSIEVRRTQITGRQLASAAPKDLSKVASGAVGKKTVKGFKGVKGTSTSAPSLSITGKVVPEAPSSGPGYVLNHIPGEVLHTQQYRVETARSLFMRQVLNVKQHKAALMQSAKYDDILEVLMQDD